jgi:hypothetical protein
LKQLEEIIECLEKTDSESSQDGSLANGLLVQLPRDELLLGMLIAHKLYTSRRSNCPWYGNTPHALCKAQQNPSMLYRETATIKKGRRFLKYFSNVKNMSFNTTFGRLRLQVVQERCQGNWMETQAQQLQNHAKDSINVFILKSWTCF